MYQCTCICDSLAAWTTLNNKKNRSQKVSWILVKNWANFSCTCINTWTTWTIWKTIWEQEKELRQLPVLVKKESIDVWVSLLVATLTSRLHKLVVASIPFCSAQTCRRCMQWRASFANSNEPNIEVSEASVRLWRHLTTPIASPTPWTRTATAISWTNADVKLLFLTSSKK